MSVNLTNHFKGKRLHAPHGEREIEGRTVPLATWKCWCGRRLRGDVRLLGHLDRSGHGVAVGESKLELVQDLRMMLRAFDEPVIEV